MNCRKRIARRRTSGVRRYAQMSLCLITAITRDESLGGAGRGRRGASSLGLPSTPSKVATSQLPACTLHALQV